MLTKFPVTTDRGEYRVDIKQADSFTFAGKVFVNVYIEGKGGLFKSKWKCVEDYEYNVSDWRGDVVGLARDAVRNAEYTLLGEKYFPSASTEAIAKFQQWDGDMTTKEESR